MFISCWRKHTIADLLTTEKIKKENSIIVGLTDLDELIHDNTLRTKIRAALDGDRSIDKLRKRLHVPLLLLYQCAITAGTSMMNKKYVKEIRAHVSARAIEYFKRQEKQLGAMPGYEDIHFHLIVFPVPNKERIVKDFIAFANALKGSTT